MPILDTITEARRRGASDDLILQKIEQANPKVAGSIATARQRGADSATILSKIIEQNAGQPTKLGTPTPSSITSELGGKVVRQEELPPEAPAVGGRKTIGQIVAGAGERFQERADRAADIRTGSRVLDVARGAFQTAGAAAGAVGEVGFGLIGKVASAFTPDVIEDPIREAGGKVIAKVANTEFVRKAIDWAERNPEYAADIESALDLAGVGTLAPAARTAGAAARTARQAAKPIATKLGQAGAKAADLAAPDPAKLRAQMTEKFMGVVRPEKSDFAILATGRHTAEDVSEAAAKRGLTPDVKQYGSDFKQDWSGSTKKLRSEMGTLANEFDNELARVPGTVQGNLGSIKTRLKTKIGEMFNNAEEAERALREVNDQLAAVKRRYGTPSLQDMNRIKRGMWEVGYDAERPMRSRVARLVGHEIAEQIEQKAAKAGLDTARLAELNMEMGRIATLTELLENATGRVVDGGKMATYFAAGIGSSLGGGLGSIVPGAGTLIGGAAGAFVGMKGAEFAKRITPVRRAKEAAKLAKTLGRVEARKAEKMFTPKTPAAAAPKIEAKPKTTKAVVAEKKSPKAVKGDSESALVAEAKKYKSADEFVKAQGTSVYHGTNVINAEMIKSKPRLLSVEEQQKFPTTVVGDTQIGISSSKDLSMAQYFASLQPTGKGEVLELVIPKKAKIYKLPNDIESIDSLGLKELQRLKKAGYDAIEDASNLGGENEIRILSPELIKTKSQLTDIWEKANGGGKGGYRIAHQIDSANSRPASSLENLDDIVKEHKKTGGYLTNYDLADLKKLKKMQGNPDAEITIYRASPVNELNEGDWVTTSKTYAQDIKKQNGGKVYTHTVKAGDLLYPKDLRDLPSLARFSAFQFKPKKKS